jgi:hypothetical protein
MFPAPRLISQAPGRLELNGAVGKVYRIDRALSLEEPAGWEPVTTQRLERPFLDYLDEAGLSIGSNGFYRAMWLR